MYGNEHYIGNSIKKYLKNNPDMRRSDIFLTTKIWCQEYLPRDAYDSIVLSLERLKVDYIDCALLHLSYVMKKNVPFAREDMTIEQVWRDSILTLLYKGM